MDEDMTETAAALDRLRTVVSTGQHKLAGIPVQHVTTARMRPAPPKALAAVVADLAQERGYRVSASAQYGVEQADHIVSSAATIRLGLALEPFPSMAPVEPVALPKQPFDPLPVPPLPLTGPKQQELMVPEAPKARAELVSTKKPLPLPELPGAPPAWGGQQRPPVVADGLLPAAP